MKPQQYRVVRKERSGNIYFINIDPAQSEDYLMYDGNPGEVDINRIYDRSELVIVNGMATLNELHTKRLTIKQMAKFAGF